MTHNEFDPDEVKTVLLFPGQGGYSPGIVARAARYSAGAAEIVETVRGVARDEAGVVLDRYLAAEGPELPELLAEDPAALQFLIYAASTATAAALREAGVVPSVLVGHSFGEISALAAAGACSVRDGARVVASRVRVLRDLASTGYMISATVDRDRAEGLVSFLGETGLTVAGRNERGQTVFSGPAAAMDRLVPVLTSAGANVTRLASPHPFHSPVLAPAVERFRAELAGIAWTTPTVPVHSPIEGRVYNAGDDLGVLLAGHLTRPFDFWSAVRTLHTGRSRLFVECGGRDVLTGIVKRVLAGEDGWEAVATDATSRAGATPERIARLATGGDGALRDLIRGLLSPAPSDAAFDRYWSAESARVVTGIRDSYERFCAADIAAPVAAQAPVPAPEIHEAPPALDRARVLAELIELYGEALEYPAEVFSEDVDLEGDLGVDSVKQTDLLGRVARRYGLPPAPSGLPIGQVRTMGQVADLVVSAAGQPVAAV
ncbi:acyltransferase domain-containing protein [Actinoplanes sp. NPDC051851]|uniref:acyltransferase domain-containing protein n=1 Tax=Actinoplanes sp. NPDC051851 TaxID=3154753 RepID=UPI003448FBAB